MTDTLNFCLTFDNGLANVISAFSRQLSLGLATDYVLGPEALPHVTVLKLNTPSAKAVEVWSRLQSRLPRRLSLRFEGLRFMPGKKGDLWMEIAVARSAELDLLQELSRSQVGEYGIRTAIGDNWRPHVTLLHSVDGRLPASISLDASLLLASEVVVTPTLGKDLPPGILVDMLQRPDL